MERIKQLCQKSDVESLFCYEDFEQVEDVERHIDMLKTTQEREEKFFWQESAASNLLAFLYLNTRPSEDELALEQLSRSLEHDPNNINAIIGTIRILEDQCRISEAKKKALQYEDLTKDSRQMEKQKYICQGEIAYAFSFTGPAFYIQAVEKYEDLLGLKSGVCRAMKDELKLNGYIIRWQYYLAYTYNRMLNRGHKEMLAKKLGTKDACVIFDKIYILYDEVISSDDVFYKGKAMIDLVDTYKKCETSGKYQNIKFPYGCSPDVFVRRAMEAAPSDPHVLERCGRHYRQRACSKKNFDEAVAIFDTLLELHPTRHVGWHHKGLACRAVWHIVGKYDEARLYNNSARTGDKKQVRKQKRIQRQTLHTDGASATISACREASDASSVNLCHQDACKPPSSLCLPIRSLSADEQAMGAEETSQSQKARLSSSAPRELPTLPSRNRRQIGEVPRQTKKPDYFDKLRTNNPPVKNNASRKYLEQAKECFMEAKRITKGKCSPYIVDLARTLVSLGLYEDAEKEFAAARKLKGTVNNYDATYLYEQWALLRLQRAKQEKEATLDELKDVAFLCRLAIRYAVLARERSRVAFYQLRDLLYEQLQRDPDANNVAILKLEYMVLYSSVEKFSECKEILVAALGKDEETRNMAWEMIQLLHERHHQNDAAIAYMYLTALHEANQLDLEDSTEDSSDRLKQWELLRLKRAKQEEKAKEKQEKEATLDELKDVDNAHRSKKKLLLDVVWRLVSEDQRNAESGRTFGEIFRWMVGTQRISDYMELDKDSPKPFSDCGEICVLAPSTTTPGVNTVVEVLHDVCGIEVVRAFCGGNCDVPCGGFTSEGLRACVAVSQAVIVVTDTTDEYWKDLILVLEELTPLMKTANVKTCMAAEEDGDEDAGCCSRLIEVEERYTKHWSPVVISRNGDRDNIHHAYRLLQAMFC